MIDYGDDFAQRYQELFDRALTEELHRASTVECDPEGHLLKRRWQWNAAPFYLQVIFITNNFFAHFPGGLYRSASHVEESSATGERPQERKLHDHVLMRARVRGFTEEDLLEVGQFNVIKDMTQKERVAKNVAVLFVDMLEEGFSIDELSK